MKKLFRKWMWRFFVKRMYIHSLEKVNVLIGYPMIMFICLGEAEELYIENGYKKFQEEIVHNKIKEIGDNILEALRVKTPEEREKEREEAYLKYVKWEGLERKEQFDKCRKLIENIS